MCRIATTWRYLPSAIEPRRWQPGRRIAETPDELSEACEIAVPRNQSDAMLATRRSDQRVIQERRPLVARGISRPGPSGEFLHHDGTQIRERKCLIEKDKHLRLGFLIAKAIDEDEMTAYMGVSRAFLVAEEPAQSAGVALPAPETRKREGQEKSDGARPMPGTARSK